MEDKDTPSAIAMPHELCAARVLGSHLRNMGQIVFLIFSKELRSLW